MPTRKPRRITAQSSAIGNYTAGTTAKGSTMVTAMVSTVVRASDSGVELLPDEDAARSALVLN